jgi:tetratricopeptide (TPR) repeat protein
MSFFPLSVRFIAPALLLALSAAVHGETSAIEIRVTGEHRLRPGDTAESATRLALVDGRHKARQAAVARLRGRPDVAALRLEPGQLEAYSSVIVTLDTSSDRATRSDSAVRVGVRARVDAGQAARQMAALQKDQDVTDELLAAWTRMQRLQREVVDQTRQRASTAQAGMLAEQQLVTALNVMDLTARAYAALARTEPVTVGGRATPAAGRARARQLAEAALAMSPDSPDAHYLMGDWLFGADDPAGAEVEYRKALAGDTQSSGGRIKLAAALRYQGKVSEALVELREAQKAAPASARAYRELGMIMRAERNLPESIAAYREAVRLDPDSTDAHNGLAVVLANSGKLEEAAAEFREMIRIDPDSTVGYYNLAYALADLDRDVESAAALREVIRINPDHYNARYNLGELFRLEEKYDDSATQFREYLRLAPDAPQNRRNIARARGFVRQFEDPDAPAVIDTMMPRQTR